MPWLTVPALRGQITFDSSGTTLNVSEAPSSRRQLSTTTTTVSGISHTIGQLEVMNLVLTLAMAQSFSAGGVPVAGSSNAALRATASGSVRVGGASGFTAVLGGSLDVSAQGGASATFTIDHVGGWSPVSGSLADKFRTPAFSGTVAFGAGSTIQLSATAQWLSPITLVSGLLVITAHPSSAASGASLSVALSKTDSNTAASYAVDMSAGLQLGDASSGIPKLAVEGLLVSSGTSTYARAHVIPQETAPSSPPVAPSAYSLPDVFPCLMRRSRSSLARAAG